jgi:hypothetical protein
VPQLVKTILVSKETIEWLKLDLAVAALTLCSGGVVGALLGEITWMQAAGRVVLDALCRENMLKTFRIAGLLSRNKVLEFAIGKSWERIKAIATLESKIILEGVYMDASVGRSFIAKPHTKQYVMEKFLVGNSVGIRAACKALINAPIATGEKERLFDTVARSHFCKPPLQKVLPENYYRWIELTFYLKLVINSDWLIQYRDNVYGFRSGYRKTPIHAAPGERVYPTDSIRYKRGFYTRSTTRVEYDDIGQQYIDRMNTLYAELFPGEYSPLIDSRMLGKTASAPILEKAYRTLKKIGHMNTRLVAFGNGHRRP